MTILVFLDCLKAILSTFQKVALCVFIERKSGPLDKVTLQLPF